MIAGRYSLDREIGRGGMGAVWLGRDEVLGRPVALKRVGLVPGGTSPDLERAEREARLAARLNHPHVVAVFDLVDEAGERWLVMEHVPGTTLAELVRRRGPLPPDRAAQLLAQAADALAAAHAAGIVHRDVKPSNMLVSESGRVKLSDFGIARAEADASLTQTGLVTGSPAYLAPEVASGRLATPPSDVWSLGASLFHALAGHPPYDVGDNVLGALYRIVHEDPPRLETAGWLAPLLAATMAREAPDRWAMSEVRDFLQAGPDAPLPRPVPVARAARGEASGTQVLPPGTTPLTAAPPGPRPVGPPSSAPRPAGPPPGPPAARPAGAPHQRGRTMLAVLAGVAGLVLLVVVAYAVGLGGSGGTEDAEGAGSADPSTSRSPSETRSPSATAPPGPTEAGVEAFVRDYLRTAATDPSAGYEMLTPTFQQSSGGLTGYTGFWGRVRSIDGIERVEADVDGPGEVEVRYLYRYTLDGGVRRTDDVRLRLRYDDGRYRIAGER